MKGLIESIAFGGKGVARCNNKVYFIPFTVPGEEVTFQVEKEKKSFGEGSLVTINTPSPHRIPPRCIHFTRCGGCSLQHMNYESQCNAKAKIVEDTLLRIGKLKECEVHMHKAPEPWGYRRHIRLNLRKEKNGFQAGYIGFSSNSFVPVAECHLSPMPSSFFKQLQTLLLELDNTGIANGSLRILFDHSSPVLAFSFAPYAPKNSKSWAQRASYPVLFKSPKGLERFGSIPPSINPYGFTQCNEPVASALYTHIESLLTERTNILDLYGGAGTLGIRLAHQRKKVTLVEQSTSSCKEAQETARRENVSLDIHNKSVEQFAPTSSFDSILINPPREGVSIEALRKVITMKAPSLIYTSCMPSTLARDLAILTKNRYEVESVNAFDMFPQTSHVETVVSLKYL